MSDRAVGVVLVVLSALGLGTGTIFAKLAYDDGVGFMTLLGFRYALAACVLVPAAVRSRRTAPIRLVPWLALSLVYVGSAACFWLGINLGRVTDVAPIAYLYPGFVALIAFAVYREGLTRAQVVGIVFAAAGSALIFGVPSTGADALAAKALALGCAVLSAIYYAGAGRLVGAAQGLQGAASLCLVGAVIFLPLVAATGFDGPESAVGWVSMIAIVVTGTVLPLFFVLVGLARISSTETAVLTLGEPLVSVSLAVLVLGEHPAAVQFGGIACVAVAFLLTSLRRVPREAGP